MQTVSPDARFRMRLAQGFLEEAEQDATAQRWRSCVDNSQLATENAAKAVVGSLRSVGRTHRPAALLRIDLANEAFPPRTRTDVERLAELAELLGPDLHAQSDYGDEATGRTPWELFDEDDARECLGWAREAVKLAARVLT